MSEDEQVIPDGPLENSWKLKVPKLEAKHCKHCLIEESSFATLFPKYREQYLRECWPLVVKCLSHHFVKAELDVIQGTMMVRTTMKTWDPAIILKARDLIKLLSRSVPFEQAQRVLEDDIACDIIKISSYSRNRDKLVKRRDRIIGPNGSTLKAIELLTKCYVLVQGQTVSSIGSFRGLAQVRRIVEDTMKNIHPVYNIKIFMIERELMSNPEYKPLSWERFLPVFKNKNISKRKKPKCTRIKKQYTPFPPPQPESKLDKQLASGEYFLKEHERAAKKMKEREENSKKAQQAREERRKLPFVPPTESAPSTRKPINGGENFDVDGFKKKIKQFHKKRVSS